MDRNSNNVTRKKVVYQSWNERPKVVLVGDSIVRWANSGGNYGPWPSILAHRLSSHFDLNIRSLTGANSSHLESAKYKLFPKSYVDQIGLLILFIGSNNSYRNTPIFVEPKRFERNLEELIEYFVDQMGLHKDKILILSPIMSSNKISLSDDWKTVYKLLQDSNEQEKVCGEFCKRKQISYLRIEDSLREWSSYEEVFADDAHLSHLGSALIMASLWPEVKNKLSQVFPNHDDFALDKPLQCRLSKNPPNEANVLGPNF